MNICVIRRTTEVVIRYIIALIAGLFGGLATFIVNDGLLAGGLIALPAAEAPVPERRTPGDTLLALSVPTLATYIRQSRQAAIDAGVEPIPAALRARLADFFEPALLDRVRYRVGEATPGTVAALAFELRHKDAIVLMDVIVFRTPEKARNDVLWAHELTHVRQYTRWGVTGFVRRYLEDRKAVEWPAYQTQFDYEWATRSEASR